MNAITPPLPAPDFVTMAKVERVHIGAQLELDALRDRMVERIVPQVIAARGDVVRVHAILERECGIGALEIEEIGLRMIERLKSTEQ